MAKTYASASNNLRAWLDCTSTSPDNDYYTTIKLSGGIGSVNWGFSISSGVTVTGNVNGTTKSASGGFSSATNATTDATFIDSWSVQIKRGTSAKTVTVSVNAVNSSGYKNSNTTASVSVSVPALTTHTISYDANGGSGAPSSQTKTYGYVLNLSSTVPTKAGYAFSGWKSAYSGTVFQAGQAYGYDVDDTLTAQWTATTYTVSYDANGGSGAPDAQTKTHGTALTLSSTVPTRELYSFASWNTAKDGSGTSYAAGATYAENAAAILYAQWSQAYSAPTITGFKAHRSTSTGAESDDGTYLTVSFSYAVDTVFDSSNKAKNYVLKRKKSTSTSWTSTTVTLSASSGTVTKTVSLGTGSGDYSWNVAATVTDTSAYAGTATATATIGPAAYVIDIGNSGKSIGFGTAAPTSAGYAFAGDVDVAGALGAESLDVGGSVSAASFATSTDVPWTDLTMSGECLTTSSLIAKYRRWLEFVNVNLQFVGPKTVGAWSKVATLPEGCRPHDTVQAAPSFGSTGNISGIVKIETDGTISIYGSTAAAYYYASITFLV